MGGAIAAPTDAELGAEIESTAPPENAAPEAEAAAPEGQQEPQQEQEQDKRRRFVPHEALHEARTREREAREEAKAARQVLERLVAIQERQAQPQGKADTPAIPDLETDPVGHFKAKYEALERTVQQVQQPFQQQAQRQQFIAAYASKASEFKAETPDFDAAYSHAQGALANLAGFYGISPADAEIQLAEAAMRQGKNPGQAIYEFAKANGYTGQKAAPEQKAAPDLSAVARGQEAARGRGGLPSAGGELTVEALAKMSFKEIAKIPSEKLDRIMGAR